jgi:hypothetical protein
MKCDQNSLTAGFTGKIFQPLKDDLVANMNPIKRSGGNNSIFNRPYLIEIIKNFQLL